MDAQVKPAHDTLKLLLDSGLAAARRPGMTRLDVVAAAVFDPHMFA
jgi:hypothetical protein